MIDLSTSFPRNQPDSFFRSFSFEAIAVAVGAVADYRLAGEIFFLFLVIARTLPPRRCTSPRNRARAFASRHRWTIHSPDRRKDACAHVSPSRLADFIVGHWVQVFRKVGQFAIYQRGKAKARSMERFHPIRTRAHRTASWSPSRLLRRCESSSPRTSGPNQSRCDAMLPAMTTFCAPLSNKVDVRGPIRSL